MPPFSSPTPEDEAPEPPKGRRPYSSPTADPETEERRPRRLANRPDKLVATGPPRPDPSPAVQPGPESRSEADSPRSQPGPRPDPERIGLPPGVVPRSWFQPERQSEAASQDQDDLDGLNDPDGLDDPHDLDDLDDSDETRPTIRLAPYVDQENHPRHADPAARTETDSEVQGQRRHDPVGRAPYAAPASGTAYADPAHPAHADPAHADPAHADRTHVDPAHADRTHADPADQGYAASADQTYDDYADADPAHRADRAGWAERGEADLDDQADGGYPADPSGHGPAVRRVGRPPAGRPTRPDLLVASGPPRPSGSSGRHHRGPAPAALRRAGPVRRRGRGMPIALVLALLVLVGGGVLVWQWRTPVEAGLRLSEGTGQSGDDLFTVPAAGDGSHQVLNDMASVGRAVVAVGSDTTNPTPRPLFLFSSDGGKTWQLGQVTGSSARTVQRVVGGKGLWLASGGADAGQRGLWTSTDGYGWTAVEQNALSAFKSGDQISDIARTASGFVAVGQAGPGVSAAWQSADGRAWQRVDTHGLDVGGLAGVVAKGDTVVALAQPAQGGGSRVVRSADGGRTWQATGFQLPEAMPAARSLAVLPKQFVLVPIRQRTVTGDVRVYCSPTGARWAQCGSIRGLSAQSPGVESLISYPAGIAAVSQSELDEYSVLTSADASDWNKRADLGDLSSATLRGFTIADSGTLFAVGDQAAADAENQPVLMTAPPSGGTSRVQLAGIEGLSRMARETTRLAVDGGRYVVVGSASGDAGIWTSLNWGYWTAMSLGGPNQQILDDVAHGRRGWLAVGSTEPAQAVTEPLLVSSSDGKGWQKVAATGDLARLQDHSYLDVHAVAAGTGGYVLAGEDRGPKGTGAALWFSSDLRKYTRSKKLPQSGAGVRIHALTATPSGYVAVGGSGGGDEEKGVVWFSADGVDWKARDHVAPPGATSAGLREVTAYQGQVVAIGTARTAGTRRAFAAVSDDDGETWRTAWLPTDEASGVYDLASSGQGLVAVGRHGTTSDGDGAAWTSQDGLTWNRLDLKKDRLAGPGMQYLAAVTISGTEVVALGRSTTYSADHLILWTSTLTSSR